MEPAPQRRFRKLLDSPTRVRTDPSTSSSAFSRRKYLEGYGNTSELYADSDQAVRFYINNLIHDQSLLNDIYYFSPPTVQGGCTSLVQQTPSMDSPSAEGATDYQTCNQEKGVDESDMVKSDGVHVFAAYGDIVVIWNAATGNSRCRLIPVPPIDDSIMLAAQLHLHVVSPRLRNRRHDSATHVLPTAETSHSGNVLGGQSFGPLRAGLIR
jgi:hypothetical protein